MRDVRITDGALEASLADDLRCGHHGCHLEQFEFYGDGKRNVADLVVGNFIDRVFDRFILDPGYVHRSAEGSPWSFEIRTIKKFRTRRPISRPIR